MQLGMEINEPRKTPTRRPMAAIAGCGSIPFLAYLLAHIDRPSSYIKVGRMHSIVASLST